MTIEIIDEPRYHYDNLNAVRKRRTDLPACATASEETLPRALDQFDERAVLAEVDVHGGSPATRHSPPEPTEFEFVEVRWAETGHEIHPDDFDRLEERLLDEAREELAREGREAHVEAALARGNARRHTDALARTVYDNI